MRPFLFTMKNFRLAVALLLLALPIALLEGCGGGGGGGGGTATPTPTVAPTPTAGARVLVVQLRDPSGQAVDGIVSIGEAPVAGVSVAATVGGQVSFNRNIAVGATKVSADVDGDVTSGTATIKASDTTVTYVLRITPRVTPVPATAMPTPPFTG